MAAGGVGGDGMLGDGRLLGSSGIVCDSEAQIDGGVLDSGGIVRAVEGKSTAECRVAIRCASGREMMDDGAKFGNS